MAVPQSCPPRQWRSAEVVGRSSTCAPRVAERSRAPSHPAAVGDHGGLEGPQPARPFRHRAGQRGTHGDNHFPSIIDTRLTSEPDQRLAVRTGWRYELIAVLIGASTSATARARCGSARSSNAIKALASRISDPIRLATRQSLHSGRSLRQGRRADAREKREQRSLSRGDTPAEPQLDVARTVRSGRVGFVDVAGGVVRPWRGGCFDRERRGCCGGFGEDGAGAVLLTSAGDAANTTTPVPAVRGDRAEVHGPNLKQRRLRPGPGRARAAAAGVADAGVAPLVVAVTRC